jgi:membrane-bound ClpP family serine protease
MEGSPADSSADSAELDTYHDHEIALNWAVRLETAAWLPLILAILSLVLLAAELFTYLPQAIRVGGLDTYLSVGIPLLIPAEATAVCASLFVLLRAASQALLLLLDIQEDQAAA